MKKDVHAQMMLEIFVSGKMMQRVHSRGEAATWVSSRLGMDSRVCGSRIKSAFRNGGRVAVFSDGVRVVKTRTPALHRGGSRRRIPTPEEVSKLRRKRLSWAYDEDNPSVVTRWQWRGQGFGPACR